METWRSFGLLKRWPSFSGHPVSSYISSVFVNSLKVMGVLCIEDICCLMARSENLIICYWHLSGPIIKEMSAPVVQSPISQLQGAWGSKNGVIPRAWFIRENYKSYIYGLVKQWLRGNRLMVNKGSEEQEEIYVLLCDGEQLEECKKWRWKRISWVNIRETFLSY